MRNVAILDNPGACREKCANKSKRGLCKLKAVKFILGVCDSKK